VTGVQTCALPIYANLGSRRRRMHESPVAEVDAHMRVGAPQGVEEDEVARLQARAGHLAAGPGKPAGVPRRRQPDLAVYVMDEPAAVEAGGGAGAAPAVGHAHEREGAQGDFG